MRSHSPTRMRMRCSKSERVAVSVIAAPVLTMALQGLVPLPSCQDLEPEVADTYEENERYQAALSLCFERRPMMCPACLLETPKDSANAYHSKRCSLLNPARWLIFA